MPWIYESNTGELYYAKNGAEPEMFIARGYSGAKSFANNTELEWLPFVGPIPAGEYTISLPKSHSKYSYPVMELKPRSHDALNRDNFLIHGDNSKGDKSASQGCIILGKETRDKIGKSNDKTLIVVRKLLNNSCKVNN